MSGRGICLPDELPTGGAGNVDRRREVAERGKSRASPSALSIACLLCIPTKRERRSPLRRSRTWARLGGRCGVRSLRRQRTAAAPAAWCKPSCERILPAWWYGFSSVAVAVHIA